MPTASAPSVEPLDEGLDDVLKEEAAKAALTAAEDQYHRQLVRAPLCSDALLTMGWQMN